MCGVPVLVFANKQDLLQALPPDQVISAECTIRMVWELTSAKELGI